MAFKSIDTAPKDETVVLLQVPRSDETDGVRIGWWHEGDWYDNEEASHSVSDMYGAPTGWAPLPDAKVEPTTAEGGMTWQPIETAPQDEEIVAKKVEIAQLPPEMLESVLSDNVCMPVKDVTLAEFQELYPKKED